MAWRFPLRRPRGRARPVARLAAGTALLGAAAGSADARADWIVGLEPTASLMVDEAPRIGPTLAVALGYSPDLYPLLLVPELAFAGSIYPGSALYGIGRAQAGLRVGVTAAVEPAAYLRVGYGFAAEPAGVGHGLALDAGAALEGRLSREVTLGGLVGYQGLVAGDRSHHGLTAGLRLGVWF